MEIVVISLPSASARRERLAANLASHGLSCHWIDAVDARGWQADEVSRHTDSTSVMRNMSYYPNPGAIGCHLSHIKACEYLINSDEEAIIILEDDVLANEKLPKHMACLSDAMGCLDIIFLCDSRANRPSALIGTSDKGLEFRFKRFSNIGSFGYVINRKAARHILNNHAKFGLEIDMMLNRWWHSGLYIATTNSDLVVHEDMGSSIGYDNKQRATNPVRRITTTLVRSYYSLVKRRRYKAHHKAMKTAFEKARHS